MSLLVKSNVHPVVIFTIDIPAMAHMFTGGVRTSQRPGQNAAEKTWLISISVKCPLILWAWRSLTVLNLKNRLNA